MSVQVQKFSADKGCGLTEILQVRSMSPMLPILVMFCMPGILGIPGGIPVGMAPRPPVGMAPISVSIVFSMVTLSWVECFCRIVGERRTISSLHVHCCQTRREDKCNVQRATRVREEKKVNKKKRPVVVNNLGSVTCPDWVMYEHILRSV